MQSGRGAVAEGLVLFSLKCVANLSLASVKTGSAPQSHSV